MSEFKKIDFGEISAEIERANNPNLIKSGFIDLDSIEEEAIDGRKFLFLGYKGSGKSSIGERVDILSEQNYDRFSTKVSLADFPFTPFSKIVKGDIEPEAKFPTAWSWILLIYVLESFEKDHAATHSNNDFFREAIKAFRDLGISPGSSPSAIVRKSSQKNFSIKLPYELASYQNSQGDFKSSDEIYNFVEVLKTVVSDLRSPNKHFLIIDGLDDILSNRNKQYRSLYALMNEAAELNQFFLRNSVPFKIIVLCRTDMFEKILGPNKNKIRQAYAFELNWYHDPNDPDQSMLVRAVNKRAELSLDRKVDVFVEFFPSYIYDTPTRQYLLDMTRHTPRDFLQLLTHMKKFSKNTRLTGDNVKSGLREYSIQYFYPEIQDEMSGYADEAELSAFMGAFARLRKRDFSFEEFYLELKEEYQKITEEKSIEILRALFNCSAIGNIEHDGKKTYYTFKYRNRISSFIHTRKIMLHRGLWKALNIQ